MENTRFDIAGSAVYWTLGESTDFSKFSAALKSAGFHKNIPDRPTDYACLRDALQDDQTGAEVFPVKGTAQPTFEVVRVRSNGQEKTNEYRHVMTAWVTPSGNVETDTGDSATDWRLTDSFRRRRETLPYHAVSRSLVEIIFQLQGVSLRPSGGIYWIPTASFERWEMVANAVEMAGHKNKAFALKTMLDEHSATALREALSNEIERESREIESILSDPETGMKSARTQKIKAKDLRRKIEAYEDAFTISLNDLKKQLDRATGIEAIATVYESAASGPIFADPSPISAASARPLEFAWN